MPENPPPVETKGLTKRYGKTSAVESLDLTVRRGEVYGLLGFFLASIFWGTALAIGLGLAWILAVENTISLLPIESDLLETIRKFTVGENTLAVSNALGTAPEGFGIPEPLVEPERVVTTLVVYMAIFVVVSAIFLKRRDVA